MYIDNVLFSIQNCKGRQETFYESYLIVDTAIITLLLSKEFWKSFLFVTERGGNLTLKKLYA